LNFGDAKPLIVLTADKDAKLALQELIRRHADLGIRLIDFDVVVDPHHDGGVFKRAHEFLRPFLHVAVCPRRARSTESCVGREEVEISEDGWIGTSLHWDRMASRKGQKRPSRLH
jgi:hypothetical protein